MKTSGTLAPVEPAASRDGLTTCLFAPLVTTGYSLPTPADNDDPHTYLQLHLAPDHCTQ